jgi:hypothetical protein
MVDPIMAVHAADPDEDAALTAPVVAGVGHVGFALCPVFGGEGAFGVGCGVELGSGLGWVGRGGEGGIGRTYCGFGG